VPAKFLYTYDQLIEPIFKILKDLGGSASNSEINDHLVNELKISDEQAEIMWNKTTTTLAYRAAWARTYLKKAGYIANSERGVWQLTQLGEKVQHVHSKAVVQTVMQMRNPTNNMSEENSESGENDETALNGGWKEHVLQLINQSSPNDFEKLCGRLLRELGFVNVTISGRPNDGGIDGFGVMKLGPVLTFHVAFQAKRYQKPVGSEVIRNFRGSIMGRAEKGIVITTSTFTRAAMQEAKRDGATAIDLIDGDQLTDYMKTLKIGIHTKMVEKVIVEKEYFK
jgi:restriction system protein